MLSITSGGDNNGLGVGKTNKEVLESEAGVDALPYIDNEYEETGMKELVMNMIEEEKRRYRPMKNYLEHLSPLELHRFETDIMTKEFERIGQRNPMELMSMKRYELPPPPTGKLTDITAWSECLDNSYAQLEHQATRICNLELMLEYGAEGWRSYLAVLHRMVADDQKKLQSLKREIQELNWNRKSSQIAAGDQLERLQNSWIGLISKNYEIELACQSKELIKYESEAQLAQLKFIISEAESDRSGSRVRRRVRRFFMQNRNGNLSKDDEDFQSEDEDDKEEEEEQPETKRIKLTDSTDENLEQPTSTSEADDEVQEICENNHEDEEEIGPQPYYFPDADKIENDPDRSP